MYVYSQLTAILQFSKLLQPLDTVNVCYYDCTVVVPLLSGFMILNSSLDGIIKLIS